MEKHTIFIKDISKSHNDSISVCHKLVEHYKKHPNTELIIDFSDCEFIYPDYALLLLCSIKHIEHLGYKITGFVKCDTNKKIVSYLAKMGFFESLEVKLPFKTPEIDSKSAVQIQKYTTENQTDVLNSILNILRNKSSMNDDVFASLDYCFNEVLDNVLNHTEEKEGWVVAQYYEKLNSIRLIVCDFGLGIHKSLNQKHNFSEEEAIQKCIESGVTNGKGQGHGLYATSLFAKLNKGWLSLMSGNKKLNVNERETTVRDIDYWQGTCVYIRINTNVGVDYKEFTSEHYDYKLQLFEDMFGNSKSIT